MASPIRVLIPVDSQEPEAWGLALAYAEQIAEHTGSQDIVLVTHAKEQLRHTGLAEHMGAATAKALAAGKPVALSSGATLRHGTLFTLRYFSGKTVIIAYYADEKLLDFVDAMDGLAGVVVVPWIPGESDAWRERWMPIVHGEAKQEASAIIDDPVVEAALLSLTGVMNLAHPLLRQREKDWSDETFRILRAKGHAFDPAKVKSWAIRGGWKPGAAEELSRLARTVADLKTKPRLSGIHDPDGRYARWTGAHG